MSRTLNLSKKINSFCENMEQAFHLIPTKRKEELLLLSAYIAKKLIAENEVQLIVICTHNSRRSHIGQLWLAVAADYYGLQGVQTFSGGTEATAFNHRAVKAFQKIGFDITTDEETATNPVYKIKWRKEMLPYLAFSKAYETAPNPQRNFGAILVCSQANEACPFVVGADFRIALPYDDPKAFDDTELEEAKYAERIEQIGREMLFVLHRTIL